jgi:hypothetical protein
VCYYIFGFGLKTGFGIDGLGFAEGIIGFGGSGEAVVGDIVSEGGTSFSETCDNGYFLRMGFIRLSF